MPLVSVVIPCYGQAHFLGDAIESVLAQRYPAHEIIVIDDGSPDDAAAVARRYPTVHYVRQENRGLSEARNSGLRVSSGEFLVFLDADDRLLPNALSAGVAALTARPDCGFVWGFRRLIDVHGNPVPEEPARFEAADPYPLLLRENIVGPPVVVMFRRSVFDAVGGFSPKQRFSEDYEMFLRIAGSHPAWCHGELVAEYRLHDTNMSLNATGMLEGILLALDAQETRVAGDPALRRALREGKKLARRRYDGWGRMNELSQHSRAGHWGRATLVGLGLLFRYPRMFFPVLLHRVKRAILPSRE